MDVFLPLSTSDGWQHTTSCIAPLLSLFSLELKAHTATPATCQPWATPSIAGLWNQNLHSDNDSIHSMVTETSSIRHVSYLFHSCADHREALQDNSALEQCFRKAEAAFCHKPSLSSAWDQQLLFNQLPVQLAI